MAKKPVAPSQKLRPDVAENAFRTMMEATGQAEKTVPPGQRTEKNAAAVERGSKGGKIGGRVRAKNMPPEQRRMVAEKAAAARWSKDNG